MEHSWLDDYWVAYSGSIIFDPKEKENFCKSFPLTFRDKIKCSKFKITYQNESNFDWQPLIIENYWLEVKKYMNYPKGVRLDFSFHYKSDIIHYVSLLFDDICRFQIDFHGYDKDWFLIGDNEKLEWIETTFNLKVQTIFGHL